MNTFGVDPFPMTQRLCFLIFLVSTTLTTSATSLNFGDEVPDWSLKNSSGEVVDYYDETDKKISVILFWATWCPYCETLMPHLEVIHRRYRSKGVKFYAINIFEDGEIDPVAYFTNKKYTYLQLLDGDELAEKFGVRGTPALYVVDKNKKVIYKRPGGVSDILVKQNIDLKIKSALRK